MAFVPAAGVLAILGWSSWVVDAAWSPSWAYTAMGPAFYTWSIISAVITAAVVRPLWRLHPAARAVGLAAGVVGLLVTAYFAIGWWMLSDIGALG